VVPILDPVDPRLGTEPLEQGGQQVGAGEGVSRALHEEHGDLDPGQMAIPHGLRLLGRVEGVAKEDETFGRGPARHDLRRDPSAHRSAPEHEPLRSEFLPRVVGHGAGRGLEHRGLVGQAPARVLVGEVVENGLPARAGDGLSEAYEKRVVAVAARAVPEDDGGRTLSPPGSAHGTLAHRHPDLGHDLIGRGYAGSGLAGRAVVNSRLEPSMYEAFYGFTEKPFNLTPDPKYLYLSPRHTEAVAHLEFGRRERGGFILITGEVGTGKTTLARYFLGGLPANTATAVVLYPALSAVELLRSILDDFHVPVTGNSLKDHVNALHRFLLLARSEGRDVVLLIDEAQDLAADVLEQVRLLSNLETDTEKLIQIVLMGQSELRQLLERTELRQLAQRVTARYHLEPLSRHEINEYVRHRLAVAGGEGKVAFTANALDAVHQRSAGIPRLVNSICDRALLAGFVKGLREINAGMVRLSAQEVLGRRRPIQPSRRWTWVGTAAAVAALLIAALALPRTLRAPEATPPRSLPSVSPTAPPPAPTPYPDDARLDELIATIPREVSRLAALSHLQGLWGTSLLERTSLRTHLDQVRRLDYPLMVQLFHPLRRDTAFAALVGLEGPEAQVVVGDAPPLRVSAAALDRLWTRDAVFLWQDPGGLARATDSPHARAFARAALERLGYASPAGLPEIVSRFQRDHELLPDGVIGDRTLMVICGAGSDPRPRLKTGGRIS
jgi:general secretion pathway protein A